MKTIIAVILLLMIGGCNLGRETFDQWVRDPHFTEYKAQLDSVEKQYLNKDITFAEYSEQKKQLDEKYELEVKTRQENIDNYR